MLYSLDLFRTNYIPITEQEKRDIMRRVWLIIDMAFDGSELKVRNERGSTASKVDMNKRRKVASINPMEKQKAPAIPDLLIYHDRTVEANKRDKNDAKEKNDCRKLLTMWKQMLLHLSCNSPSLQHDLTIVGLSISNMKLAVHELFNPKGVILYHGLKPLLLLDDCLQGFFI